MRIKVIDVWLNGEDKIHEVGSPLMRKMPVPRSQNVK